MNMAPQRAFLVMFLPFFGGGFVLGTWLKSDNSIAVHRGVPASVALGSMLESEGEPVGLPWKDAPTLERLRAVIASPQSEHRLLEVEFGVADMDKEQVKELWKCATEQLDFTDNDNKKIASALLRRMVSIEPGESLRMASQLGTWKNHVLPDVIGAWATEDPQAAIAWIAAAGSGVKSKALGAALREVGDFDRRAALQLFESAVEQRLVSSSLWGRHDIADFFQKWSRDKPATASQEALAIEKLTSKANGVWAAVRGWATVDAKAALHWLDSQSVRSALRNELTVSLVDGWADISAPEAAAFALTIADEDTSSTAVQKVLNDWVTTSFVDAAQWIESIEDVDKRRSFESKILKAGRLYGNRNESLRYGLEKFEANRGLSHALYMQMTQMAQEDPVAQIPWVKENISDPLLQEEMFNTIIHNMRSQNPALAAQHIALMPDPLRRADISEVVAQNWAERDLESARTWANSLPESQERDRALMGVTNTWMQSDAPAVGEWIASLEQSELTDRLRARYLSHIAEDDVARALEFASSIEDPFRRDDSLEYVMGQWLLRDRASALPAIRENRMLSETARWRLLEGKDYGP